MATINKPIVRMDENAFRASEKPQPKVGRKALTDMTNSKKPHGKNKSPMKNFKPPEKVVKPKISRKPLGDLTNSNQPRAQEVKKNRNEQLDAVNKGQSHSFGFEEGFLHNHDECIKDNQLASTMSVDYFLEIVGLKEDSSPPFFTPQLPRVSSPSKLELETAFEIEEIDEGGLFSETCRSTAPTSPSTPKCPGSPCWTDMAACSFLPRLKDSPLRG